MYTGLIRAVCIAIALAVSPSTTFAAGPASAMRDLRGSVDRMKESGFTLAPFAAVKFCLANQDQCTDTGGDDIVNLTEDRNQEMLAVNAGINRAIRPANDRQGTDVWSVDVVSGDCEDYALTKRKHLLELGWPSRALRLSLIHTSEPTRPY